jgi:hypothetical protein
MRANRMPLRKGACDTVSLAYSSSAISAAARAAPSPDTGR